MTESSAEKLLVAFPLDSVPLHQFKCVIFKSMSGGEETSSSLAAA